MKPEQYALLDQFENDFFWFVGLHELTMGAIQKFYVSKGNRRGKVFDAGCGTGALLRKLSAVGEAFGMDYSAEAIRFCRIKGLERAEQKDLEDWNPAAADYDVVTCLDVLYHAGIKSDRDLLRKFHKALKPEGLLILNVPAFELLRRDHDKQVETERRYRRKPFLSLLNETGFDVKMMTYRLPFLFPLLLLRKFFFHGSRNQEIRRLPSFLNRGLLGLHRWENRRILNGGSFPFGSSLFAVAMKI